MKLLTKVRFVTHKIREYGLVKCWRHLKHLKESRSSQITDVFDQKYGVDTGEIVPLYSLTVQSPNAVFGVQYQPSPQDICEAAIRTLPIRPEEFCFVDLGAGKGRVLLIASVLGFKRLIGVEFAEELVKIARKNLLSCTRAEIIFADAADYDFPDENLVVYMFNPFERPVMEKVIYRLAKAAESKADRRVFVIYHNPRHLDIIQRYGNEVALLPHTAIYQIEVKH
jgi:16S rRNA G966 N2-methylase RsmD